jgi:DHA3 family macrolide efflux protein-like MFS transporter
VLAAVYFSGNLQLWEIYPTVALSGAAAAFQYPALSSAVPLRVRQDQLTRANGLLSTSKSIADVCGPALAAALVGTVGLGAILVLDLVSLVVALISVRLICRTAELREPGRASGPRRKLAADSVEGLRYLFGRPSLRDLILVVFTVNLVMVFGFTVLQPMILARTGNDTSALAIVTSSIGVGGVAGGLLLGVWGGPKSRVKGMLLGVVGMCLTSQITMAVVRGVTAWCVAIFAGALLMTVVNGTLQAVIQTKVPEELHGRVFGAVLFGSQLSLPVAMVCSGPLADHVFEPQAAAGDGLVGLLEPVVGRGPGSGMAVMLLIAGVCGIAAAGWGISSRTVREIDAPVPDLELTGG